MSCAYLTYCVCLFVYKDMAVPEPGETQQSVCEAVGGPTEADMHVSDQEDIRLLLQVQTLKTINRLAYLASVKHNTWQGVFDI